MTFNKRDDWGDRKWERRLSPEEVLIRRQAEEMNAMLRTCAGCRHVLKSPLGGPQVACDIQKRPAKLCIEDTRRCDEYNDERKNAKR